MIVRDTGSDNDAEMSDDDDQPKQAQVCDQALAKNIIEQNITAIGEHLFAFWGNHQDKLSKALTGKRQRNQPIAHKQLKEHISMMMTAKDLIFVLSELSGYLHEQNVIKGYLTMLI